MTIARVRERSRERRSSPPPTPTIVLPPQQPPPPPQTPQQQQAPVVIRQSFHDRPSSDDESSVDSRRRGGRSRGRGRSHSHVSRRSSPSRSRSRSDSGTYMTVRDYEIERKLDENRRQLEALRMAPSPHPDAEQYELTRARRELEELRAKDERDAQLEAQRSGEEERWESRMSNYELARTRRDLEELRAKDEREAQLEAQRAGEEERWETRRSKYELEDLRAREAREAREKSEAARRAADFENFELLQSKKELEALKAQQQREKDAMEKIHEARTQMELMSAKEELDRSKSTYLPTYPPIPVFITSFAFPMFGPTALNACNILHVISMTPHPPSPLPLPLPPPRPSIHCLATHADSDTIVKQTEEKAKEERRIRREIELKQLEEQRRAEEEQRAREQADADAVERWKAREAEKAAKEQREKERTDREVRLRLREHLAATGMPEDQIQAILDKKKFDQNHGAAGSAQASQPSSPAPQQWAGGQVSNGMELAPPKTTYTRMARRHLSLETLRARGIDYDIDLVSRAYLAPTTPSFPQEQRKHRPPRACKISLVR